MRQFFSWRIWLAFGSLIGLVVLLRMVLPAGAADAPTTALPDRSIDFVSFVYQVQPGARFFMLDGVVNGSADVIIDGQRTMHLVPGTPGQIDCPEYKEIGRCVVVADLLGDAVVWFDLVPVQPAYKVNAAPIVDILDDGVVRLASGWLIGTANPVDRRCKQETGSLREFISDYGPESITIIDVATQQVAAVVCADTDPAAGDSSTTSSNPASTNPDTLTSITTVDPGPAGSIPQEG